MDRGSYPGCRVYNQREHQIRSQSGLSIIREVVRMSFDIDVSVVATLLLAVLVLGYGAVLGALVMWVGRIDERPPEPVRTAEPASLRQAA